MSWRFAFFTIRESLPPLDLPRYQIHIAWPRNGLWDLPPATAEAPGKAIATTSIAVTSASAAIRARVTGRRSRVVARGRLPVGLRLVVGARISPSTRAETESPRFRRTWGSIAKAAARLGSAADEARTPSRLLAAAKGLGPRLYWAFLLTSY